MATKEEVPPPPEGQAAPPKKNRKLLAIIVVAGVALLAVMTTVVVLLMRSPPPPDPVAAAAAAKAAEDAKAATKVPAFERLETFTVNLLPDKGEQYLQAEITLEMDGIDAAQRLKSLMPRVRNQVNLILAGKKASEVMPKEGKEALAAEIRDDINAILAAGQPKPADGQARGPVMAVLFTSFIIQ